MKVTGQNLNKTVGGIESNKADKSSGQKSTAKNAAAMNPASASRVDLSTQSQAVQKAKQIAGDQSVDEAKVQRLQKLIDEGKYKVDSSKVADRLVDEHLLTSE